MTQKPKHPEVTVQLTGEDGNTFSIIGRVTKALRHAGVSLDEIDTFRCQAMSGDYDHVLRTCMEWVETEQQHCGGGQPAPAFFPRRTT